MDDISAGKNVQKTIQVQLLGGFSVSVDGLAIPEAQWKSRRARNLVKLLALAPSHRLHRDQLIEILWPESDFAAAANNFHQTLHTARRVLEPAGAGSLMLEEGFLSLSAGEKQALMVDVEQFEMAATQAKNCQDPPAYQAALAFYKGDLLPDDLYEEWTIQRREALRQIRLNLWLDLGRLLEARQEFPPAIETLLSLLVEDKDNEEAHALLMRLYALNGQRQQALRQYQALCEALRADLDIEPSETTARLFETIQFNRLPPATVSAPPQPPAVENLHNLPGQLTSFIGREKEIIDVCQQVRQHRLVTLTGSGGTGKTRLALRVAEELLDEFIDGVWYFELAPVVEPESIAQEIISRLGLQNDTKDSLLAFLVNYLRGKKLLLLLDNCEHLLDACAQLATRLLQQCPDIRLLTTSREVLSIAGEIAYRVPSLFAPDPDKLTSPAELAQVESVQLFAERAAAVLAGFNLSQQTLPAVARICYRLDGIPLAIELAAARVGVLSVEQIAARLDDRFRLLTGGSRTALPRQRTLRASIDWSYSLLPEHERLLLQRLSVFSGGWNLPAAEAVCSGDDLEEGEILDVLAGLVNKSLVAVDYQSGLEARYHMLETIRQYAQERLEDTGQAAAIRDRHMAYILALAQEYEPLLHTPKIFELLERLDVELGNLRGAMVWVLGRGDRSGAEQALKILCALFYFWLLRPSLTSEVSSWANRAFTFLPQDDAQAVDLKAWSLLILSMLDMQISDFTVTFGHLNPCIALYRQAIDRPANRKRLALALARRNSIIRAYIYFLPPDPSIRLEDAQRDGEESLLIAQELLPAADPETGWFVAWIYIANALAGTFTHASLEHDPRGKYRIDQLLQTAYEISTKFGDKVSELNILHIFATDERYSNTRYIEQGISLAKRLGYIVALSDFYNYLGNYSYRTNQFHDMEENFHEFFLTISQLNHEWARIYAYRMQGIAAVHQGDFTKAQSLLRKALDLSVEQEDTYGALAELNAFAGLALLIPRYQDAARLLGFFERQLEGFFKPMDEMDRIEFEQHTTRAREKLGEAAFTALWAEGRAMTMEQALQIARTELVNF
jgi:predicted ATPase/DNA-binding SARP family transcriptional activator